MKKINNAILLLALFTTALLCGCSKQIDGQVFVSTQEGNSYKLGSVQVSVVKDTDLTPVLKQYIADSQTLYTESLMAIKKIAKLVEDGSELPLNKQTTDAVKQYVQLSVLEIAAKQIAFDNTNISKIYAVPSIATTSTDAEGKFSISTTGNVSPDNCYLLAKAERSVLLEKSERYYWVVKLSNSRKNNIMLNNLNVVELEFDMESAQNTTKALQSLIDGNK